MTIEEFWHSRWIWLVPVVVTIAAVGLDLAFHWHWLQYPIQAAALVQLMAATHALKKARANHREAQQLLDRLRAQQDALDSLQLVEAIERGHIRKH